MAWVELHSASTHQVVTVPSRSSRILFAHFQRCVQAAGNGMDPLRYAFIVSQAELVASPEAASEGEFAAYAARAELEEGGGLVAVGIARADGRKCNRCWNYRCVAEGQGRVCRAAGVMAWGQAHGLWPARKSASNSNMALQQLSLLAARTWARTVSIPSCASAVRPL